mgnify:FL=1|jgi:betaine reductase
MAYRVVHYINQFYGGKGGEEVADFKPSLEQGPVGPGLELQKLFGDEARAIGTIICGDGYYAEHIEKARAECLKIVEELKPDLFIAGPAFNAGRYGVACGYICAAVVERLGIPSVTGMFPENPGVELYSKQIFIVKTADSARGMREALTNMARLGLKLLKREPLGSAFEEGYIHRGIRKNFFKEKRGSLRAIDMLLQKIAGQEFRTEYEMPVFKKIPPAPPIKDLKHATIALVTSGGIVPRGNPDRLRVSSAESYAKYDISGLDDLTPENFESIHGGYDRMWANVDPDVVVPLDVMRELEREGVFNKLHPYLYTTTGTGTSVVNAERFGREIGHELKEAGVDGVILTST